MALSCLYHASIPALNQYSTNVMIINDCLQLLSLAILSSYAKNLHKLFEKALLAVLLRLKLLIMARQTGIIRLKGTIGGVSFYKTADGHLAREKGGVDGNRIKNDPAFQRTRENGSEFGTAGTGAKLIRNANRILIQSAKDRNTSARLTREVLKVVKTDPTNDRGERQIVEGNMELLEGFEFNKRGRLSSTFFGIFSPSFDRAAGEAEIAIDAFQANNTIAAPGGTTHYKIVAGASLIDFEEQTFETDSDETGIEPWDSTQVAATTLSMNLSAAATTPALLVFGIQFYQEVNGQMYVLNNGAFNALQLVLIDQD